jgi:hypothetical protein
VHSSFAGTEFRRRSTPGPRKAIPYTRHNAQYTIESIEFIGSLEFARPRCLKQGGRLAQNPDSHDPCRLTSPRAVEFALTDLWSSGMQHS